MKMYVRKLGPKSYTGLTMDQMALTKWHLLVNPCPVASPFGTGPLKVAKLLFNTSQKFVVQFDCLLQGIELENLPSECYDPTYCETDPPVSNSSTYRKPKRGSLKFNDGQQILYTCKDERYYFRDLTLPVSEWKQSMFVKCGWNKQWDPPCMIITFWAENSSPSL